MITDKKIQSSDITTYGVVSAPDKLVGNAQENKAVFDRLIRESVMQDFNGLIDDLVGTEGAGNIGKTGTGTVQDHIDDTNNPHQVTKAQVGLGNVDNTSDANKPISSAANEKFTAVETKIDGHIANKSNPHKVTKAQVGLGNVDNTADVNKPISTPQAAKFAELEQEIQDFMTGLDQKFQNFLAKDNTTPYTPSGDYNPATKKFVEDSVSGSGNVTPSQIEKWDTAANNVDDLLDGTKKAKSAENADNATHAGSADSATSAGSADTAGSATTIATPNATATHSGGVVAITAPAGVNLISFYAPSDFSGDDTYTVNGSAVTLTDLNGNAIYDGWKEGAPVQLILKGTQAFFKSGGGVNDTLPPLNPNMTGELADGVFTVTADKLPVAQADALAGAEWYYGDHVPARPGDGTKVELSRNELVVSETPKALSEYATGDIVKIRENNAAAEFIVAMHNYESSLNGEGRTLLVRKDIYDLRAWDAALQKIYSSSDIDDFANTGYKNLYSAFVQGLMGTTKFPCMSQRSGPVVTIEKSVFILSMTEYGKTSYYAPVEGSALAIAESLLISDYNGEPTDHYTRTITLNDNTSVWRINDTGGNNYSSAAEKHGFRPCFTIPSTTEFGSASNELIEDATAGVQTLADTTNLGDETEGSIVTLQEDGAAVEFYVAKQNYEATLNGEGRVLLVRKDVFDNRAFSAANSNVYKISDLDAWQNGDYKAKFSQVIQQKMGTTKIKCAAGGGNATVETIERAVFSLSGTEMGQQATTMAVEGETLTIAANLKVANLNGSPGTHWTRSSVTNGTTDVWYFAAAGNIVFGNANQNAGSRPCFTLPADMQVNPDGSIVESDNSPVVTLSIPWTESGYCYCRQFPYNSKHQYQTQLVGAVATNDPDYGTVSFDPVFGNNSWTKIKLACDTNDPILEQWAVGDEKDAVVAGETLTFVIVGKNIDDKADGTGKAPLTIGMKNLMASTRQMNSTNTNSGSFVATDLYEYLTGTVLPGMPEEMQAAITPVNKKTSADGGVQILTNAMSIWLFAEIEIFGQIQYSAAGEGVQYPYFATASNRIKTLFNGSGSNPGWWERSPRGGGTHFCSVSESGTRYSNYASTAYGVCFGFCV